MKTFLLLMMIPVLVTSQELLVDAAVGSLSGKVTVVRMPAKPMPEYITLAECRTLTLKGGTIKNFCASYEPSADGEYRKGVLFAAVDGVTFINCNLDNIDTSKWTNCKFVRCTTRMWRARKDEGNVDWKVNPDGSWGNGPIDTAAVEVIP